MHLYNTMIYVSSLLQSVYDLSNSELYCKEETHLREKLFN